MRFLNLNIDGIAVQLKELRNSAGITQEQMAEFQGVDKNTVSNWERNVTPIPMNKYLKYEELAKEAMKASSKDAVLKFINVKKS